MGGGCIKPVDEGGSTRQLWVEEGDEADGGGQGAEVEYSRTESRTHKYKQGCAREGAGAALVFVVSQRDGAALALPGVVGSGLRQCNASAAVGEEQQDAIGVVSFIFIFVWFHLHGPVFAVLGRPLRCWGSGHVGGGCLIR